MSVWIVTKYHFYAEDRVIEGVFATEEAAKAWIADDKHPDDCELTEHEVQS